MTETLPEEGDLLSVGIDDIERGAIAGFPERHQDPFSLIIDADQQWFTEQDRNPTELVSRLEQVIFMADLPDPVVAPAGGDVLEKDL